MTKEQRAVCRWYLIDWYAAKYYGTTITWNVWTRGMTTPVIFSKIKFRKPIYKLHPAYKRRAKNYVDNIMKNINDIDLSLLIRSTYPFMSTSIFEEVDLVKSAAQEKESKA